MKRSTEDKDIELLDDIPNKISDSEVLSYLRTKRVDGRHIRRVKTLTNFNDELLSYWFNVSVKTLRSYMSESGTGFKENVKEHVILLLTLIKHGINVFGDLKSFDNWLIQPNFYFDNRTPNEFLNTTSGVRFVDDRLTAMEYGDNV
jgi:uncharacterized protein (DUF2384 family)